MNVLPYLPATNALQEQRNRELVAKKSEVRVVRDRSELYLATASYGSLEASLMDFPCIERCSDDEEDSYDRAIWIKSVKMLLYTNENCELRCRSERPRLRRSKSFRRDLCSMELESVSSFKCSDVSSDGDFLLGFCIDTPTDPSSTTSNLSCSQTRPTRAPLNDAQLTLGSVLATQSQSTARPQLNI
jgi:hypothetical protein